jgi:peroxiredoxin
MAENLPIGQRLPDLNVVTAQGQPTSLAERLGPRQTLVYFVHGTWCPRCVGQLHLLERYRPQFASAGVDIVVVTGEDLEPLQAFLRSAVPPLQYTVLADPKHAVYQRIGAGSDTVAVLADRGGVARWTARWPDHQEEPDPQAILDAVKGASNWPLFSPDRAADRAGAPPGR